MLSEAEAAKLGLAPAPKVNKYGARKVILDGYTFDSKAEADRYHHLKILQSVGEIRDLMVHPEYLLSIEGEVLGIYEADFKYRVVSLDKDVVEDVKGLRQGLAWDLFRLKAALLKTISGIQVFVYPAEAKKTKRRKK